MYYKKVFKAGLDYICLHPLTFLPYNTLHWLLVLNITHLIYIRNLVVNDAPRLEMHVR